MRAKRRIKLAALGVIVSVVVCAGALAMAQNGRDAGALLRLEETGNRARQSAQALADAHQGNRAVALLAEVAQREIERVERERPGQLGAVLEGFNARAEEHLIAGNRQASEAQAILGQLVQQLRGGDSASAAPLPTPTANTEENELTAVGQPLVVEAGRTVETASVVWGDLVVRGHVTGDAVAVGGNVRLEPGARVDGDVVSVGGSIEISPNAWVGGDRVQVDPTSFRPSGLSFFGTIGNVAKTIGMAIALYLLGIVVASLAPNRVRNVIGTLRRRPLLSVFSGFLTLIVTLVASVLLGITFIGIPIVVVLLLAVGIATLIGLTGVACLVGEAMPGKARAQRTAMRCLFIGVIVLTLVSLLPFGNLLLFLALASSVGAVILSRVGAVSPS